MSANASTDKANDNTHRAYPRNIAIRIYSILNKTKNAPPNFSVMYVDNRKNQKVKSKCFAFFIDLVVHNSKRYTVVIKRLHRNTFEIWQGSAFSGVQFEKKSHTVWAFRNPNRRIPTMSK